MWHYASCRIFADVARWAPAAPAEPGCGDRQGCIPWRSDGRSGVRTRGRAAGSESHRPWQGLAQTGRDGPETWVMQARRSPADGCLRRLMARAVWCAVACWRSQGVGPAWRPRGSQAALCSRAALRAAQERLVASLASLACGGVVSLCPGPQRALGHCVALTRVWLVLLDGAVQCVRGL